MSTWMQLILSSKYRKYRCLVQPLEAVPRTWYVKPELYCSNVGVPADALSPPATLSPPSSPSVTLPSSPWSPGATGSSSSTAASSNPSVCSSSLNQLASDRFSAFTLVSTYNPDTKLQNFSPTTTAAARGNAIISSLPLGSHKNYQRSHSDRLEKILYTYKSCMVGFCSTSFS